MSSDRISKRYRSSTERRRSAALKIQLLGFQLFGMGRCTPCHEADSECFVLKGHKRCARCEDKNIRRCDGNFSEVEFASLEAERSRYKQEAQAKRAEVGRRAAAAAQAYAELAKAQQEEIDLQAKIDEYTERQSRMLRQELDTLNGLDVMPDGSWVGFADDSFSREFTLPVVGDGFSGPSGTGSSDGSRL